MPAPKRLRLTLAFLGLAASTAAQAVSISSRFDTGNDGWVITDIVSAPGTGLGASWDAANLRITTPDITTWTTFSAPAAYLGNLSAYYGGSFSFDLRDSVKDANADAAATFGIATGTVPSNTSILFWFGGSPSTTLMTNFAAPLSETDAHWRLLGPADLALLAFLNQAPTITSGSAPTSAQFQSMLANVSALRISADWKTGGADDVADLDNVVLASAVPEPGSAALMAAGLAWLGWRRRKARS